MAKTKAKSVDEQNDFESLKERIYGFLRDMLPIKVLLYPLLLHFRN